MQTTTRQRGTGRYWSGCRSFRSRLAVSAAEFFPAAILFRRQFLDFSFHRRFDTAARARLELNAVLRVARASLSALQLLCCGRPAVSRPGFASARSHEVSFTCVKIYGQAVARDLGSTESGGTAPNTSGRKSCREIL